MRNDPPTDDAAPARARANLFPSALPSISNWAEGRLEARAHVAWSSQALCVSVWGALAGNPRRAAIVAAIFEHAGIDLVPVRALEIECEVRDRRDVLNEFGGRNPTCPDVLLRWPEAVVTVESKFNEHLSRCGQAPSKSVASGRGAVNKASACSGNYEVGSDLRTRTEAACRLIIPEGRRTPRRYWEVASQLFRPDVVTPPSKPCPFADGRNQLMRNLSFAASLAQLESHPSFGFLLSYVGAAHAASDTRRTFREFASILLPDIANRVGEITYEAIGSIVRDFGEVELSDWIGRRTIEGTRLGSTGT